MAKGKTRLKGLEVSKVDFVDEGANPETDGKVIRKDSAAGGPGVN